jgi:cell division protein ZapA (FtsZ GTPase activity inhibitor)
LKHISIKVNIADRIFPLTIPEAEEEKVRKAAKLVNDKVKSLQQEFAVKDKQDILSMIALENAAALIALEQQHAQETEQSNAEIANLAALLSDVRI